MKKSRYHFIMFLSLTLLFCFTFSCQEQAEEAITSVEASSFIQSSLAVFNEGNLTVIDELYDSNYVRHDSALPEDIVGLRQLQPFVRFPRARSRAMSALARLILPGVKTISPERTGAA